jgi:hypothetical protein
MMTMRVSARFILALASIALVPLAAWAGPINGTITGSSVNVTGGYDITAPEKVTVSTIDISYFTSCYFITNGVAAGGFGAYNFVFAGQGVAAGIPNIDPSDFTVSQYAPWVVNNNASANYITDPAGRNINRDMTLQDAGGANIVISYKPQNAGDPTTVNFVQAYILNTNNAGFTTGTIDNGGSGGPFYNEKGVSGTGTTASPPAPNPARLELATSATKPAWLVDIPLTPEKGYSAPFADETITSETDTFQTFISGKKVIDGTTYNVLYGGIQWGYTFTTVDVPEPGTLTLLSFMGPAVLFGCIWRRRRARG